MISKALPGGAYFGKIRSALQAAANKGYDAILSAVQPYMSEPNYGRYVSNAVNGALSNPAVTELKAAVDESAGSLQSVAPEGGTAAPVAPAAQQSSGLARGGTRAVQRWQENYNRRNKLKPGMPGYLNPNGAWGPATQAAYQKMQAGKQPAAPSSQVAPPDRELPPMPGEQAPAAGQAGPQKIDILKDDARRNALVVQPQLMKELGSQVNMRSTQGPKAISYLKQVVWSVAQEAAREAAKAQFRNQASRDTYIQNYILKRTRDFLTPENLAQFGR